MPKQLAYFFMPSKPPLSLASVAVEAPALSLKRDNYPWKPPPPRHNTFLPGLTVAVYPTNVPSIKRDKSTIGINCFPVKKQQNFPPRTHNIVLVCTRVVHPPRPRPPINTNERNTLAYQLLVFRTQRKGRGGQQATAIAAMTLAIKRHRAKAFHQTLAPFFISSPLY